MWLDSSLNKTHEAPIDPATGETNEEQFSELLGMSFRYSYCCEDDEEREALKAEYKKAREGMTFAQKPHFMEHTFIFGANSDARAYAKDAVASNGPIEQPQILSCHPETWAAMTEEFRAQYDVKTEAELQMEMEACMKPKAV